MLLLLGICFSTLVIVPYRLLSFLRLLLCHLYWVFLVRFPHYRCFPYIFLGLLAADLCCGWGFGLWLSLVVDVVLVLLVFFDLCLFHSLRHLLFLGIYLGLVLLFPGVCLGLGLSRFLLHQSFSGLYFGSRFPHFLSLPLFLGVCCSLMLLQFLPRVYFEPSLSRLFFLALFPVMLFVAVACCSCMVFLVLLVGFDQSSGWL